tara:strand:- start:181 stop:369 length:189 start_codon:yes stop_codon:yes gene_type:complete
MNFKERTQRKHNRRIYLLRVLQLTDESVDEFSVSGEQGHLSHIPQVALCSKEGMKIVSTDME